jgi:glycosyltransferase involved in cell wall biosynthesis
MPVSIFIQTLDEEANLPGLLDSVAWADDIVVLDSLSTDSTRAVAEARGCRWYERAFDGRGAHQNWAMEHIDFKHEWVFYLDADERMRPELRDEILAIADDPDEKRVAFYCGRRNYFMGKWIRHAMPPGDIMRFFKPPHIRFERRANPIPTVDGEVGYLRNHFDHDNFSKGIHEWLERHNRYSTYEAEETVRALRERPLRWGKLLSRDRMTRRFELKNLSFRMPGRPLLKFLYMYLLKLGILDGRPGLTYCVLQAIYEYQICVKVREMRREDGAKRGPRSSS